jgi:membrane protease YdiL (CAAX protease family)
MVRTIVSGGQTGADRAGLDVAQELGLAAGGWVPRGRRAEDGAIPDRYTNLSETESESYEERTRLNVRDSDATVIFTFGPPAGGSAVTADQARTLGRPLLVMDLDEHRPEDAIELLRKWLARTRPATLNVAGARSSEAPGIAKATAHVLRGALRPAAETEVADSRSFVPSPLWAGVELVVALAVIVAGLKLQLIAFALGSAPWLTAIGLSCIGWRGPGIRAIVRGAPLPVRRAIAWGAVVGVAYQFVGTLAVEPVIARLTTGELPDVSQFRGLVGNELLLAFWIALSWTLAACLEEVGYRGWILTRFAELGRYSRGAWIGAMLASSVLFGIVHSYQGVSGMISTGLTGLVFAGVYLATGRNLIAAIVAHGSLDTIGFVLMYLGVYPGL